MWHLPGCPQASRRKGEAPGSGTRAPHAMTAIADSTSLALSMIGLVAFVALYVWLALALAAVFRKSGEEGWKAWVPILNLVVLLRLGALSPWLLLLALIPGLGVVAVWVVVIIACHRIGGAFGYGPGMTVLAALLLPVWATVIGFGSSRWVGADTTSGARRTPPPDDDDDLAFLAAAFEPDRRATTYAPIAPPPAYGRAPASGPVPPPLPPTPAAAAAASAIPAVPPLPAAEPEAAPEADSWEGWGLRPADEFTGEVTGAVTGAPAPISAVPGGGADADGRAPGPRRAAVEEDPPGPLRAEPEQTGTRSGGRPAAGHPCPRGGRGRPVGRTMGSRPLAHERPRGFPRDLRRGVCDRRGTGCRLAPIGARLRVGAAPGGRDPRRGDRRDDHHPPPHTVVARAAFGGRGRAERRCRDPWTSSGSGSHPPGAQSSPSMTGRSRRRTRDSNSETIAGTSPTSARPTACCSRRSSAPRSRRPRVSRSRPATGSSSATPRYVSCGATRDGPARRRRGAAARGPRRGTNRRGDGDLRSARPAGRGQQDRGHRPRSAEAGDEPPGPRRSSPDNAGPIESLDDDGSTVVAHRESRRRRQAGGSSARALSGDEGIDGTAEATRAGGRRGLAATLAADVPAPLGRVARAPETSARTPVRAPSPVIVARAAPGASAPQDFVDTAAVEGEARGRSRRTAALVVVTASLLAAGAATALVILTLTT